MNYTTKFLLFYGAAFIITFVAALLEAYFDTKNQKAGKTIKHGQSLAIRLIGALISGILFNLYLVWLPQGKIDGWRNSDWLFLFFSLLFFVCSIGLFYWVVFDYYKNTTNGQEPEYIGTEAVADNIARDVFKTSRVNYILAKLALFGFFTIFYIYLVLDI